MNITEIENRIETLIEYDNGVHFELPLTAEEQAELMALQELQRIMNTYRS